MASDYPNASVAALAADDRRGSVYNLVSPTGNAAPPFGTDSTDGTAAPEAFQAGSDPADDAHAASPTHASTSTETPKEVQAVLESEIGIVTMLNRLKQSIGAAKEFATFLKKRAQLEEDYSAGMRKLARATQDSMNRTDPAHHSASSFGASFGEMMDIHGRMADNGYQFSMSLHQMHEDLLELAAIAEKNRKGWKQTGLAAEQRVADLESATRKSKAKYESLADEYDRARTGDMNNRRGAFGFKGPKSAAQHEEDLLRKVQGADEDYHTRVDTLARERAELLATGRPDVIKALQDLVRECDGGTVLQVQKYASFSEKLLLSNGLSISPIKSAQKPDSRSLREVVAAIDTDRDLNAYVGAFVAKVPPQKGAPKYERHNVLGGPVASAARTHAYSQSASQSAQSASQSASQPPASATGAAPPMGGFGPHDDALPPPSNGGGMYGSAGGTNTTLRAANAGPGASHERSFSYSSGYGGPPAPPVDASQPPQQPQPPQQQPPQQQPPQQQQQLPIRSSMLPPASGTSAPSYGSAVPPATTNPAAPANFYSTGPPQLGALPFQTGIGSADASAGASGPTNPLMQHPPATTGSQNPGGALGAPASHVAKPMFGVSLDVLYERDSLAVPQVVYQCIQAVDLFGLTVEGIYRLSGSLAHVNKIKAMFDTDASQEALDFRNPEHFFHDVNSVAGLLKQFFRDLPDPLLTRQHYDRFVEAAQHDDDTVRRDSLHAVINDLPDPNYATLRALVLHLNRVVENAHVTRMTSQNLAIVFGPTLMGGSDPEKGRWHVRIIDTILQNTYQIFDED